MLNRMQSVLRCSQVSDIVAAQRHIYVSDVSTVYEITNGEPKILTQYGSSIPGYRSDMNFAQGNPTYILPPAAWGDVCVVPHRNAKGSAGFAGLKCLKDGMEGWENVRPGASCGAVSISEQGVIHWIVVEENKTIDIGLNTDGQSLWQTALELRGTRYICQPLKQSVLVIIRDERNLGAVQLIEVTDNGKAIEHPPICLDTENLNYTVYVQKNELAVFISVCFCPDLVCVIPYDTNGLLGQKAWCIPMTALPTELSQVTPHDITHGRGPIISCRLGLSGNDYVLQKWRMGPPGTGQILEKATLDTDGFRTVSELFSDANNPQRLNFQGIAPIVTESGTIATLFESPSQLGVYQNGTWTFQRAGEIQSLVCHANTIYLTERHNEFYQIKALCQEDMGKTRGRQGDG